VTFLFTDIEGSTKLLRQLGDEYSTALAEHRGIVREVCATHHGVEVNTWGDAFFLAFASANDAVMAASEAQLALEGGPVRIRMGLHTGEPRLTDEGYTGLDVHKAARIAAVGHGRQVILSQTTHALVDAPVRDLGSHRLKDLSAPEHIYQLEIADLPCDFPPLKTMGSGMRNLPVQRTSFVGRASELDELDKLFGEPDCRLVTLVGPGGVGKTRIALEAAERRAEHHTSGVHFVPLASVSAPDFLVPAVAETMQFAVDAAHSSIPAKEQLLDYLSELSALVVLDNFEHLVEGSTLLSEILERAPKIELLVTSRERLKIQSEWVFDVKGLELAENGSGAMRLFVERATQVEPSFALDEAERMQAQRICRLVGGLPLGIELAASWVSMLSCAEIAEEIEANIDFLATSMRDVPERHRSLRAVIEQSSRLLTDEQRDAFARLGVFRGSFDREAAHAVANADLRTLSELVAKSLVVRRDFGRFELHPLLRQFAAEHLALSPETLADSSDRHARHYSAMLRGRREALCGPSLAVARDELRSDLDNLRSAADWLVVHGDEANARGFLAALHTFFWAHSWLDGAETFERLAGLAGVQGGRLDEASNVALSVATIWCAHGAELGYDPGLEELALRCLPLLRARGLEWEVGVCLYALGIIGCLRDVYPDAVAYLEEAVAVGRSTGDGIVEVGSLCWLGFVQLLLDDLDAARVTFESGLAVGERLGGPLLRAYSLSKLGIHADAEGRYGDAMRLHAEATGLFDSIGDRGGTGYTLSRASMSAFGLGDFPEALRLGRAGYEAFSAVNHRWGMIGSLCRIGFPAMALGDHEAAAECFVDALERARASNAISLELLALSGIGAWLEDRGDPVRAAAILIFALGHPQLPKAYRFLGHPALDRLEAELAPEQLDTAQEQAARATLSELEEDALRTVADASSGCSKARNGWHL